MLEAVYLYLQSQWNGRRNFRFHAEQHCIVIAFLFRYPLRHKGQDLAKSEQNRFDWSWIDLHQVYILTVSRLGGGEGIVYEGQYLREKQVERQETHR